LCRRFDSAPSHHFHKQLIHSGFRLLPNFAINQSQNWSQTEVQFRKNALRPPLYNSRMRPSAVVRKFWWLGVMSALGLLALLIGHASFGPPRGHLSLGTRAEALEASTNSYIGEIVAVNYRGGPVDFAVDVGRQPDAGNNEIHIRFHKASSNVSERVFSQGVERLTIPIDLGARIRFEFERSWVVDNPGYGLSSWDIVNVERAPGSTQPIRTDNPPVGQRIPELFHQGSSVWWISARKACRQANAERYIISGFGKLDRDKATKLSRRYRWQPMPASWKPNLTITNIPSSAKWSFNHAFSRDFKIPEINDLLLFFDVEHGFVYYEIESQS
jgi:hypothetical protein